MDATDHNDSEAVTAQPAPTQEVNAVQDTAAAPVQTLDDIQTAPSEDVISQEQPLDVISGSADPVAYPASPDPVQPTSLDEPQIVENQVSEDVPSPPYKSAAALREEFRIKAKQAVREALAAQPHRGTPAFADLLAVADAIVDTIAAT